MQEEFSIKVQLRSVFGKSASRRMRRDDMVPAVLYGGKEEPVSLMLNHDELMHHLENEAFYSHILTLNIGDRKEKAILRDLQRYPSRPRVLHIDFMRVTADQRITVHVPLHFINEDVCIGVKQQGGVVSHLQTDVEVSCLPQDLPEYVELDIAELELGSSLHLSDIHLPDRVTIVALTHGEASDHAVVSIIKPRVTEVEEAAEAAAASEAAAAVAEAGEDAETPDEGGEK